MRRTDNANSDGGNQVGLLSEVECVLYCLNQYPGCVAVDYSASTGACYVHSTAVGTNWNSCCRRYEVACSGKYMTF